MGIRRIRTRAREWALVRVLPSTGSVSRQCIEARDPSGRRMGQSGCNLHCRSIAAKLKDMVIPLVYTAPSPNPSPMFLEWVFALGTFVGSPPRPGTSGRRSRNGLD